MAGVSGAGLTAVSLEADETAGGTPNVNPVVGRLVAGLNWGTATGAESPSLFGTPKLNLG